MTFLRTFLIGSLGLFLAGCEKPPAEAIITSITGPTLGVEPGEMQALIEAGAPRMIVRMLDLGTASTLSLAGTRAGVHRWRTVDNIQIYTRDGVIIGTRGLGYDLMTADVDQVAQVVTSGQAGQITRIHRQLDGNDQLQIQSYICDINPAGREEIRTGETTYASTLRVEESCYSPSGQIENRYWVRDGRILQAEQTFNRDIGRIQILFLP